MKQYKGIAASAGIGIGRIVKLKETLPKVSNHSIASPKEEQKRYVEAAEEFCRRTENMVLQLEHSAAEGAILRGHIAMLRDPAVEAQVSGLIAEGRSAEEALETVMDHYISLFSDADDELIRQRAADANDVKKRVLQLLLGIEWLDLRHLPPDTVLLAEELTPSLTAQLDRENIRGILTEKGGRTSHSAIIARALRIPAVLGVPGAAELFEQGQEAILDGNAGEVYVDFAPAFLEKYEKERAKALEKSRRRERFRGKETATADGRHKAVYANIGSSADLEAVISGDAEGIGLFRTEFLFMERAAPPDEEEQLQAYKAVAAGMKGKEVIIRTLDAGGDKEIPYLGISGEDNPFMGFRAIRYCLQNRAFFKVQLRAILRASAFGNVALLFPMITTEKELEEGLALLEEAKRELSAEGISFRQDLKVGVMIETPAACMIADLLAKKADFFSIGTNDLTGYMMAADRGNPRVEYLYSTADEAVLRAVRQVIAAAHEAGISCEMCGEAAADEQLIPLWLEYGLDQFSVNPGSVLTVRARIAEFSESAFHPAPSGGAPTVQS